MAVKGPEARRRIAWGKRMVAVRQHRAQPRVVDLNFLSAGGATEEIHPQIPPIAADVDLICRKKAQKTQIFSHRLTQMKHGLAIGHRSLTIAQSACR